LFAFYRHDRYNPYRYKVLPVEVSVSSGTISPDMAKNKSGDIGRGGKKPRFPSRENTKYPGIPREYWEAIERLIEEDEQYEGRSVAFVVTRAVRQFLDSVGRLPPKKPSET
jgi:hypothetical protein